MFAGRENVLHITGDYLQREGERIFKEVREII